jgi:hypothetical protein
MKSMSEKMKKESFKTPEQLDKLIAEFDDDIGQDQATESAEFLPDPTPTGNLVPDEFHRGQLFPQIQNYLPEEILKDLSSEDRIFITKGIQRKLTGLSANMPITCYGDSCPFKSECPLHKIGKAPVGASCPIESMVLDLYSKRYIDEFEVESDNFSEVTTMTMLAATHIMEMRGFMAIGRDDENSSPDGIIKNVVGYTPDEDPITQYQEHPGYAIIERAWRWRTKLLESLGATRKEKFKMGGDESGLVHSLSDANASLRSKIDKLTTIDITPED